MFRRIILFIALNLCVLLAISVLMSLFHVQPYLTERGLNVQQLLLFCAVWGFAGAFISLALSRLMAKWMMGVEVIDLDTIHPEERKLVQLVHTLAKKANLPKMPEVGIYSSTEVNAFATGPTRSRSLVAVSSAMLHKMNWDEIEGVLAHEISHVANGDMVTMTLLQGVVNAFVMFFARLLAFVVSGMGRKNDSRSEEPSPLVYSILVFVFEILFMILGAMLVAAYSRHREFRADGGGASLAGKDRMISALQRLKQVVGVTDEKAEQPAFQSMKISNPKGLMHLFSSHPPIEVRIERLQQQK